MPNFFQKLICNYIQSIVVLLKFRSPKIILKTLYFCHNFMCTKLLTLSQQLIAPNYQKLSSYENQRWEKGKLERKISWKVSSFLKVFWSFKSWEKCEILEFHHALSLYFFIPYILQLNICDNIFSNSNEKNIRLHPLTFDTLRLSSKNLIYDFIIL